MKCPICRTGETEPGSTTVTLERGGMTLVVKDVPAQVCNNCGEAYVNEMVTTELLAKVDSEARAGAEVNVRHFQAA